MNNTNLLESFGIFGLVVVAVYTAHFVGSWLLRKADPKLQQVNIKLEPYEANDIIDAPVKKSLDLELPDRPGKLQCYDPATGQHLGEVEMMNREKVLSLIAKSREAQKEWGKSTFGERRAVLRAIRDYYLAHQDDIIRVCCRDSGKTRLGAVLGEIVPTLEKINWICNEGEKILQTEYRGGQGMMSMHKSAIVEYEPLGVLGVLAPFNYVGHNMLNHIISGLFAGDGLVIKVSEYTAWSADFLIRPVKEAIRLAGYSPELVQIVTGTAEAGQALVQGGVDKVIFTGSDKIGKLVMKAASDSLTPVVLELGGKDPFIICEDVNLDWVLPTLLRGTFQNAGQNCIGIERVFLHERIHDKVVDMVAAKIATMRQGNPLGTSPVDIGAMTMPNSVVHIQQLVDDAVAKGAKLVCGGKRNTSLQPGVFYQPTLLTGITSDMRIASEEVFGPVMTIRKFSNDTELLEMVNNCPYALGSSVICNNSSRAQRIAKGVCAGMTNINDFGTNYMCQSLPFGGRKCSGFNKFAGPEGLRECCAIKASTRDRIPGVKTSLPEPFKYPTSSDAHIAAENLVHMAYNPSWLQKALNLGGLLKIVISSGNTPQQKKLD